MSREGEGERKGAKKINGVTKQKKKSVPAGMVTIIVLLPNTASLNERLLLK